MRLTFTVFLLALGACAFPASAQKYAGPVPPKPDVPYLLLADNLLEIEKTEAKDEKRRDETIYRVSGAAAPARTPLAEPIFLLLTEKLTPQSLELYRLEVKDGNRQIVFPEKKNKAPRTYRLDVTRLDDKLYRLEVNEGMGLENGQYSLTPSGSNDVFCFEVY
jgi:hypothetical protein